MTILTLSQNRSLNLNAVKEKLQLFCCSNKHILTKLYNSEPVASSLLSLVINKHKMLPLWRSFKTLIVLLLFATSFTSFTFAYQVTVPASSTVCFFETSTLYQKIYGSYSVQQGNDIELHIICPTSKLIYSSDRMTRDQFEFKPQLLGQYQICFSNEYSALTSKVVSLHIYAGANLQVKEGANEDQMTAVYQTVLDMVPEINYINDAQEYFKIRDERHLQTIASTKARLLATTVIKCIVIISTSAIGILLLKQLLEQKSRR